MTPHRAFVLGGARSGKSRFAENLVIKSGKPRIYVATAQAFDSEMTARIADHKRQRGDDWRVVEAPLDVGPAFASVTADEIVLLDCATLWLSNQMLAQRDIATMTGDLLSAIETCQGDVIVVSNEVGHSVVPDTALGRQFQDAQGLLNQALAAKADLAVLVVAGLPLVLKGVLP